MKRILAAISAAIVVALPFTWMALSPLVFSPRWASATLSEQIGRNDYNGNGSTTIFSYTFRITSNAHIEVLVDGVTKVLTTDYTVSGVDALGGGSITFVTAPASGTKITLLRKQPLDQQSTYIPNEAFPSTRIEKDLDKLAMQVQMLKERLERAIKNPKKSTLTGTQTEIDIQACGDKYLKANAAGTGMECLSLSTAVGALPLPVSPNNGGTGMANTTGSTIAGLPAAGTAGRLARVTDVLPGVYYDTGAAWVRVSDTLTTTLPSSTLAGLPAAGTGGRLADVTNSIGGIHKDTGTQWIQIDRQIINVKDRPFGAKGDSTNGVNGTDDTTAIANAYAAATSGIVYFPPGGYRTTGQLTAKANVRIQGAETGATKIFYSGSGAWYDRTAAGASFISDFGLEKLWIEVASPATGAISIGKTTDPTSTTYNERSTWRNLEIRGPGFGVAGTVGVSFTQVAVSSFEHISVGGFETAWLNDRPTINTYKRLRVNSNINGIRWIGVPGGQINDWVYGLDIGFGYSGTTGVGLKLDGLAVRLYGVFYEIPATKTAAAFWQVSSTGGDLTQVGAFYSNPAGATNLFKLDTGWNGPLLSIGDSLVTTGGVAPVIGVPTDTNFPAVFMSGTGLFNALVRGVTSTNYRLLEPSDFYRSDANTLNIGTNLNNVALKFGLQVGGSGSYFQTAYITIPANSPAGTGRLFYDNGGVAGKLRLLVIFPTGAAQVIASEP